MSNVVGNPQDRFFHEAAHLSLLLINFLWKSTHLSKYPVSLPVFPVVKSAKPGDEKKIKHLSKDILGIFIDILCDYTKYAVFKLS